MKSSVDVSTFSEAPVAYRWLQIEPKELKMALGDFEPFYCHFSLYDISKKVALEYHIGVVCVRLIAVYARRA